MQREYEQRNAADEEMLQEILLPGVPQSEAERRSKWLKIPRAARIAIRRLRQEFGHVNKTVLVQLLKASKAPSEYIDAAKNFVCTDCHNTRAVEQIRRRKRLHFQGLMSLIILYQLMYLIFMTPAVSHMLI